jgi:glycosyltransferase involved in cell wall biosynthesis
MTRIRAVFCNVMGPAGVAYTLTELLDAMLPSDLDLLLWFPQYLDLLLWFPQGDSKIARNYHRPSFNRQIWRAFCKMRLPQTWQARVVTNAALRNVREGDIVYVWPPYNNELLAGARKRGAVVVAERVNCMAATCKIVLERAYAHAGRPFPKGFCTPQGIAEENAQMALCDYVTAPSSMVAQSLIDVGIPADRILQTSYGWSPIRLAAAVRAVRPERKPTFAFVGSGIIRKGLNLLLDAWERADIDGRLLIAGVISDDIRAVSSRQLALPSVQELGFVHDIASVYAAADVFVFPSHEEGAPQVVYEAAGCGLPCIVSPMGVGRLVRNGVEGYVIDPFDIDGWARSICTLATEPDLRRSLASAAARRAEEFTWERVGRRLYGLMALAAHGNPAAAYMDGLFPEAAAENPKA